MKRTIARWTTWWIRLFVLSVFLVALVGLPRWAEWTLMGVPLVLAFVRPPWDRDRRALVVAPPVRGRWVAMNSPESKVPSHGIRAYGQTYAIDILHPRPGGRLPTVGWGVGMRRPAGFPTFGEPVHAVADGVVVRTASRQRDHRSRLTWPSLAYLFLVEAFFRELGGARFILGNHVVIDHGDGVHSAYAHLRRRSLRVAVGDRVHAGQRLAEVGNSGNSSEPHLHVQLMDDPSVTAAAGLPFRWSGVGIPANGEVFTAA
jgi:peptidase M23-like protein